MKHLFELLSHPYPRYGLAAALVQEDCTPAEFALLDEKQVAELLYKTLEAGLSKFRMRTHDKPELVETLEYRNVDYADLQKDSSLVQSSGLAAQGKFLYPSVITTDGGAADTYKNATAMIKDLREGKSLLTRITFSRSFAPTTAKINQNGKASLSEPPGTLFEAACSAIATLTPLKPAAWAGQRNTAIYPDLQLDEQQDALWQFVRLFEEMVRQETSDLMLCKLPKKQDNAPTVAAKSKMSSKKTASTAPKSEYRRPRLHSGNYPYAPQRESEAFGAAGLLGAIGRWAHSRGEIERGKKVLASLAKCPLYIVNYDAITQSQFSHHVIKLAQENRLSEIVHALTYDTRLYTEMEEDRPSWELPTRKLFAFFAGRFLQSFNAPAYRDFLSTRAEYDAALHPLFKEYFMSQQVPTEIVQAARELGQWINRAAYYAAREEVEKDKTDSPKEKDRKIRQQKAKILVALDSMAMGARDATSMMGSIMRETGMLTQSDAPPEALPFIDAACTGNTIGMDTARQLLMTYMRVRYVPDTGGRLSHQQTIGVEVSNMDSVEDISEN